MRRHYETFRAEIRAKGEISELVALIKLNGNECQQSETMMGGNLPKEEVETDDL